ncbi:MAG: hypothetical protein K6G07_07905, partial [Lachnospiraceae bacterium]|nr:hypothetical protein [Lachnospiraceae bacterium]
AAGLAISEKMRRLIRGLDQGARNTQDGISLLQVADGALSEVHDMLHRVTELSVQAANDTNTKEDRDVIQLEINQIMSEINRISDTTEFNEKLLFQGADGTTVIPAEYAPTSVNSFTVSGTPIDTVPTNYKITADSSGFKINGEEHNWNEFTNGGNSLSDSPISGGTYSFEYRGFTLSVVADSDATLDDAVKLLDGATFSSKITDTVSKRLSDVVTVEVWNFLDQGATIGQVIGSPRVEYLADDRKMILHTGIKDESGTEKCLNSNLVYDISYGTLVGTAFSGSGFTMGVNAAERVVEPAYYMIYFDEGISGKSTNYQFLSHVKEKTTLDTVFKAITDGIIEYTDTSNSDGTTSRVIDDIVEPNTPVVTEKIIRLGSYADSGYKGTLITPEQRIHSEGNLELWIQSGAEAGDGMFITIGTMDADTLGMTGLDVTTGEGAGNAIEAASKATEIISELRSSIGAQQNRLEHTYKNITNIAENTQAAESRLRDTDMAKEMVEMSKHNILEQAGTTMIAQANQSIQGVLSILQ